MEIRLITLDRTPERWAGFVRRNGHLTAVSRKAAVDGSTVDRADLVANNIISADLAYTNGALGCALSHLLLWGEVIANKAPMTIAEDDAVFCANFEHEAALRIAKLPPNWEVVTWGYTSDTALHDVHRLLRPGDGAQGLR
jgi:GR25 family glycosyltransferase involved in LPS biosynthesis